MVVIDCLSVGLLDSFVWLGLDMCIDIGMAAADSDFAGRLGGDVVMLSVKLTFGIGERLVVDRRLAVGWLLENKKKGG